jgi:hypothetical protein
VREGPPRVRHKTRLDAWPGQTTGPHDAGTVSSGPGAGDADPDPDSPPSTARESSVPEPEISVVVESTTTSTISTIRTSTTTTTTTTVPPALGTVDSQTVSIEALLASTENLPISTTDIAINSDVGRIATLDRFLTLCAGFITAGTFDGENVWELNEVIITRLRVVDDEQGVVGSCITPAVRRSTPVRTRRTSIHRTRGLGCRASRSVEPRRC